MAFTDIYVDPAVNANSGDGMNDDVRASLVNATYDHTGNGEGERHLSLTAGFASYTFTAGDRIYLKNAAGGVAEGSYEVASKVDDDAILLVADAGLTADSTADVDSSAGTYGDLRYAIEQETFDPTNGTRVNIKAGTAEILTETIDTSMADTGVSIAWSPSTTAQLVFQGYTSTAGDGGIGEIDGNATYAIFNNSSQSFIHFKTLKLHNTGSNNILTASSNCVIWNCEIYNSSGRGIQIGNGSAVLNNYLHDITGDYVLYSGSDSQIAFNRVYGSPTTAALRTGADSTNRRNIISVSQATGIEVGGACIVAHNSVYCSSTASSKYGINLGGFYGGQCTNNIISGFSGTSNIGIRSSTSGPQLLVRGNVVYDCTTAYSISGSVIVDQENNTASVDPFIDAANNDFRPVDTASIKEGALPLVVGLE